MSIKSIKLETAASRTFLIFAGLVCLTAAFFSAKWCFANAFSTQAGNKPIAEAMVNLAPGDPQTHYALAVLNERSFLPEDLPKALAEYEKTVGLSPNDYRAWLALGQARDRFGDAAGAELALGKAAQLAPNYAQIHWALGNSLLRHGKTEEGFAEIRRAADGDAKFAETAVTTAWQILGGDFALVRKNLGDSAQVNSALAIFLAKQKRFDEAFTVWNALPDDEKRTVFKPTGGQLSREMLAEKKFRDALLVQKQIGEGEDFAPGRISNGGFETNVKPRDAGAFEWQIADGLQPQIVFDAREKHGGNRSLAIIFNSASGTDFRPISQIIVVEPGKHYKFQAFYKSDLKTSTTLRWEIADASNDKILTATEAIAANSDWKVLEASFTVPESTEAVTVRLARDACKAGICPISGKVWFDDFSLSRQ